MASPRLTDNPWQVAPGPDGDPKAGRALVSALMRTARPRQWIKNSLVLAAPFAASSLSNSNIWARTLTATVAFCAAASGTYFLNDAADADRDRLHPTKRLRPVAAGLISTRSARAVACALLFGGVIIASMVNVATAAVLLMYVLLTMSYTTWLKHIAVVDIVAVASGFLLRAIGGAVAAQVPVTGSFLLLTSFGALFLVVGKREGERLELGDGAVSHRPSLAAYGGAFTAQLLSLALTATVLSYASWAFSTDAGDPGIPWIALSVVPFVLAMLRATQLVLAGAGADPEELFARDRGIQLAVLATAVLLTLALYFV